MSKNKQKQKQDWHCLVVSISFCHHKVLWYVFIYLFYLFLEDFDIERGDKAQDSFLDNELKKISLTRFNKISTDPLTSTYYCRNESNGAEMELKTVGIRFVNHEEEQQVNALYQEMKVLRQLNHKHIVKCYGMLRASDSVSLLMEYVKGGCIRSLILRQGALQ